MSARTTYVWVPLAMMAMMAVLFIAWPELDLIIARDFYHPEMRFQAGREMWLFKGLYLGVPWITKTVIVVSFGILLAGWLKPRIDRLPHWPTLMGRQVIYVLLALALGPGLVVNATLKDHWGRARPSQLVEFGGDKQFSAAWRLSDQCEQNCSFTSGHAAIGFFPMALAWLFTGRRRMHVLVGGVAFGLLVGLARMAQGGHFLSDVIFSGWMVYFTSLLAHWLVFQRSKPPRD